MKERDKKLLLAFLGGMILPTMYAAAVSDSFWDFLGKELVFFWFIAIAVGIAEIELRK